MAEDRLIKEGRSLLRPYLIGLVSRTAETSKTGTIGISDANPKTIIAIVTAEIANGVSDFRLGFLSRRIDVRKQLADSVGVLRVIEEVKVESWDGPIT